MVQGGDRAEQIDFPDPVGVASPHRCHSRYLGSFNMSQDFLRELERDRLQIIASGT